jgi:phosphatidylserine/phosphatidylglycerophosphate/cardiolipin synthase-like enzyme
MYLLTSDAVIGALSDQRRAGREVKVVLNRTFPYRGAPNDEAFRRLREAGVSVTYGPDAFRYTHAKCVVLDDTEAWIMTMNLTRTSATSNREYLMVDTQANDVAEAEAIFAADFSRQTFTAASRLVVSPINARARLLALVRSAKTSIDISAEALSDTELVTALIDLQKAGVTVRAVVDGGSATQPSMSAALGRLKRGNVVVKSMNGLDSHAKAVVVDGSAAYVGSINFTKTSMDENRELGVLFSEAASVASVKNTIASDFAAGTPL